MSDPVLVKAVEVVRALLSQALRNGLGDTANVFVAEQFLAEHDEAPTSAPQWTREPPTKPGWYWARPVRASGPANNLPPRAPQPVEVLGEAGHLTVYVTGWDCEESLSDFDLWSGPIEAPPIPEGK